jgi:hypothetical protein
MAGTNPATALLRDIERSPALVRSAQTLFPKLDHTGREFTHFGARAPAGFRPHLKQDLVPAQALEWARLIAFQGRVKLGFHPEQLDQRRDILVSVFLGLPDGGHGILFVC